MSRKLLLGNAQTLRLLPLRFLLRRVFVTPQAPRCVSGLLLCELLCPPL